MGSILIPTLTLILSFSALIHFGNASVPMKGGLSSPTPNACPVPNGYGKYPSAQSCNAYVECWGDSFSGYYAAKFGCPSCAAPNSCCNGRTCYDPILESCEYCAGIDCNTCPPPDALVYRNVTSPFPMPPKAA